jgi:hypothetical protein
MNSTIQNILDTVLGECERTIEAAEADARLRDAVAILLADVKRGESGYPRLHGGRPHRDDRPAALQLCI